MTRPNWLPLSGVAVSVGLSLAAFVPHVGAKSSGRSYAVSTESPAASREAGRLLERGGNAFDAAVCAALVAGFTNPSASGIGGGGFAMVWSARDRRTYVLDFRETAPSTIDASVLDQRPVAAAQRGQTVGVPGEIAGLFELSQRFGKLPWRDVVTRAARLAELGFAAEPNASFQIAEQARSPLTHSLGFRGVYWPAGHAAKLGQRLRAPRLAQTLARIAREGKRGFYEGRVAGDIVGTVNAAGGAFTLADLASYRVVAREPLRIDWAGKQIETMPPPSAGGLLLAETLALFQPNELTALDGAPGQRIHLLAEAMRGAAADRARFIGDPAFVPSNVEALLSPARLSRRKARIVADRTTSQARFGLEDAGTHHLITADELGNWVSLTTTINDPFGAQLLAEQTGILLNNQLTDFATAESVAVFGLKESPNRVRPGARPTSSMSPTLVFENGSPVLALGGSGGLTIGPNVTQVLLNRLAHGMTVEQAVAAPRFAIPAPDTGQTLWLETTLAQLHRTDLEARGEVLLARDARHAVQVVARAGQQFFAAADARKQGSALVSNALVQ